LADFPKRADILENHSGLAVCICLPNIDAKQIGLTLKLGRTVSPT
jgi:hypothetical protein